MKTFREFLASDVDESINTHNPIKMAYRQGAKHRDRAYGNADDAPDVKNTHRAANVLRHNNDRYTQAKSSVQKAYNRGADDANDNFSARSSSSRSFDTLRRSHAKETDRYTGGSKAGQRMLNKKQPHNPDYKPKLPG